ncbi:hypothetical protein [Streptomyces sp. NPDC020330]|uniref:hypothetical protein n=1 Tax=unclassified Streptomyces TaxID=2593676 RepID=UPI0037A3C165
MTFLVVVEGDAGGWGIDRDALSDEIRSRWADVVIDTAHRSAVRSLIWEVESANGPGEAYLHEDGTCLYTDLWVEDAIWLATLFRRLTPRDIELVFCDEGYTFDVRLQAGTAEEELKDLVHAAG